MPQESDHVKRIAELEAALATEKKLHYLATRLIGERDARLEDMGNRVATLEELLCDLANAVATHRECPSSELAEDEMAEAQDRSQAFLHTGEAKVSPRIAELEAALEEQEAITATAIRVTKQMAFGEVAQMLLKMAHSHKQMTLAEAAKAINDFARAAREMQEGGR